MKLIRAITGFAAKPSVGLIAGLFLVVSAGYELRETIITFSEGMKGEHGMLVYGLVVLFKSLGEMHEGLVGVGEGLDG